AEDETGETEEYLFRFRTPKQAEIENQGNHRWMRVSDIVGLKEMAQILGYAAAQGIGDDARAMQALGKLYEIVHVRGTISSFIERDQSIDRVMNIFIRVNAQGEPLSF